MDRASMPLPPPIREYERATPLDQKNRFTDGMIFTLFLGAVVCFTGLFLAEYGIGAFGLMLLIVAFSGAAFAAVKGHLS